jgi:2OG-Fe(II) oxygenase superfamily
VLQVLKYQPGQKYEEHWDWFEEEERKKMDIDDTNRIATILVYLSGKRTPGWQASCMIQFQGPCPAGKKSADTLASLHFTRADTRC